MLIFLQQPYSVSYRDHRAIVRSSFVLLSWFCLLVKSFCICPVLRWFRSYSRLPCWSIATCASRLNYIHSCPSDLQRHCAWISAVMFHSSRRHQDNGCGPLLPIVWQYRQLVCLLSADEPSQFPAPTNNEKRHSIPRHFCIVTRGFQTASQNIPIFPFIPGHRHLTYTFLLHLWT